MSMIITVKTQAAGALPRTCSGEMLGVRRGMGRLFLLTNPYGHCHREGKPPMRLALVDDHNQTIYIWYCDKAPRWAQKMLDSYNTRTGRASEAPPIGEHHE